MKVEPYPKSPLSKGKQTDFIHPLNPVESYLFKKLHDRKNTERMISFLREEPFFLKKFTDEINIGISGLNNGLNFDPDLCPNAYTIVNILRGNNFQRPIPDFEELFNPNNNQAILAADIINSWMINGENGIYVQPHINWHISPKTSSYPPESLTAGIIMDTWGVYAATTQYPADTDFSNNEVAMLLKFGKKGVNFGSEEIMPAVEESLVIALSEMKITDSTVLSAIPRWLGTRYGFSVPLLKLIESNFGIKLHPRALEPKND